MSEVKEGILYLSATPIGNLEDMTYRAVRLLKEADLIAAEDTRHTRKLLANYDIHTPIISYHEHNKISRGSELVTRLLEGQTIICVSDAGLPGISDPGADLASLAIEAGIVVSPLPGANAALSALICSGLDTGSFAFYGFLPQANKKCRALLERIAIYPETMIFYEAPHRLLGTLRLLGEYFGMERRAVAARELTKKFEEFRRDTLEGLLVWYEENEPRGEFVLLIEGSTGEALPEKKEQLPPAELVRKLEAEGIGHKEAMRETAKRLGIARREVYQALLELKE